MYRHMYTNSKIFHTYISNVNCSATYRDGPLLSGLKGYHTRCLIPLAPPPPGVDIFANPHKQWYIISLTMICGSSFPKIWDHNKLHTQWAVKLDKSSDEKSNFSLFLLILIKASCSVFTLKYSKIIKIIEKLLKR